MEKNQITSPFNLMVLVAALGYFVDVYDLVLFMFVKESSLTDIGVTAENLFSTCISMHNYQMIGMLVGGIVWGILADKKGRLTVLFGSIFLYSTANLLNGFVDSTGTYALLRFIAGFGLAGELGAGITLVTETMSQKDRGKGTTLVAAIGVFGAVVAYPIVSYFNWRTTYFIGAAMGYILLILRFGVYESGMFKASEASAVSRGNFFLIFKNFQRAKKFICLILIAVPVWYIVGILMNYSAQIVGEMNLSFKPDSKLAVTFCYLGLTFGDVASGLISQLLKSRMKTLWLFIAFAAFNSIGYFTFALHSEFTFYFMATITGFSVGYWAVFITTAAENFGTNIRATVTTTAPNFVRGALWLLGTGFQFFATDYGKPTAAMIVGIITFVVAFAALANLKESFSNELNYNEEDGVGV